MKYAFAHIFFVSLFSGLATMAADLETVTLKGTRDAVYPRLIVALANDADLKKVENRTRIARSLGIKFEKNLSSLIFQPEILHEIVEFTKRKISDHLDRLMENGVSGITVDFSPRLTTVLARLPADQVFDYLNKVQGNSFFIIDIDPTAMAAKNTCVASLPTLIVFGKIINFENMNDEQLLSIVLEMPNLVLVDNSKTYMSSLKPQDILEASELKNAVQHSLMNNGASYVEMSVEKLRILIGELNKELDLHYE